MGSGGPIAGRTGNCRAQRLAFLYGLSHFAHCPSLDLPDSFFGYAHRGPDLIERERPLATGEAETTGDNLQLPVVQAAKDLFYVRLALKLRRLLSYGSARRSSVVLNTSE